MDEFAIPIIRGVIWFYIITNLEIQTLHLWFYSWGGVSGWMWDKQIKHFTNFHCLVPDLPAQGKTEVKSISQ